MEGIPRRLRRFYREKQQGEKPIVSSGISAGEGKGFEAIPSEEDIELELKEKKEGKEEDTLLKDIESSLKDIEQRQKTGGMEDGRGLAREITAKEVKKFRDANNRLPMRTEYDQIVENVFSLMQEEERKQKAAAAEQKSALALQRKSEREKEQASRRQGRKTSGKEEEGIIENPVQGTGTGMEELDVKDILGKGSGEEIGISEGTGKEDNEFSLSGLEDEKEETGKCRNCGRETAKQVFCPECGQAFCEKCAKIAKKIGDKLEMQCPSCGTKTKK